MACVGMTCLSKRSYLLSHKAKIMNHNITATWAVDWEFVVRAQRFCWDACVKLGVWLHSVGLVRFLRSCVRLGLAVHGTYLTTMGPYGGPYVSI